MHARIRLKTCRTEIMRHVGRAPRGTLWRGECCSQSPACTAPCWGHSLSADHRERARPCHRVPPERAQTLKSAHAVRGPPAAFKVAVPSAPQHAAHTWSMSKPIARASASISSRDGRCGGVFCGGGAIPRGNASGGSAPAGHVRQPLSAPPAHCNARGVQRPAARTGAA